ncbi:MAG: LytTR family DNA-binding domain-containing protein [Lachnospiraceae bacterium]|nr:LytTR family DNA-binding domain-containing protein [Lachnospiraceae bacterium]
MTDLNVMICDDDPMWIEKSKKYLQDFSKETSSPIQIEISNSKEDLKKYEGAPIDVLFLDIELGDEHGIEIAKAVKDKWGNCQIVFVTNYLFYAMDVYDVEHTYFVIKEQFQQRLPDVFKKVLHELEHREKKLLFHTIENKEIILHADEILYFERNSRITNIITNRGRFEIRDKINEIAPRLSQLDFVRCHNSYLVYLPAIQEMSNTYLMMENQEKIIISRAYKRHVKEQFLKWANLQLS